ncbi:MAG: CoB--CoM heterodisulfide reductase iron-sulfur subunit A family protein [Desulfobacterota bacterium]|nr:CoB--CoM heterodisulfide reductase iron-sulfur subunit A family protein [Thermodesulfobacteriota bacterium]MDW8002335.1 CoB--CoM heterodisulfide reductase iron-sulfur subunit A family protein [Deltaproteobacteria bacterium]
MDSDVVIVGGGIAGISCALEIASLGITVTIVEEGPSIGGKMIMLDKTFPTLDCSSCILTPKMAEVSSNSRISLLTLSKLVEVQRDRDSDFLVKVLSLPRYVDERKCTACGACADVCAMKGRVPDEFNLFMSKRGAIYLPFPQAVPQKYLIDSSSCLYLTKGKCKRRCEEVCQRKAIDFTELKRITEIRCRAIVIATGFDLIDASQIKEFGYGRIPSVLTSLEFERILSATGPTNGEIVIGGKVPKRFYFVQCVGSRDSQRGVRYCSRVCCMYTAKHAFIVKERIKDAKIWISYIDVRAYGKGYEEFFKTVQEAGVLYIKGIPGEIVNKGETLLVKVEDMLSGQVSEIEVDVAVLALGVKPKEGIFDLKRMIGVQLDEYGFVKVDPQRSSKTNISGVFVCGFASGPKDIPDVVAHATEASASVIEYIKGKR